MKHWFPKRRPNIVMGEKIFEQDEQRTAFYRRMYLMMDVHSRECSSPCTGDQHPA